MKKLVLLLAVVLTAGGAAAQKLVTGEKAPEVRVSEWLDRRPADESLPRLVEFFHTGSPQSVARLAEVEATARRYRGTVNVILLAREPSAVVSKAIGTGGTYFAALDEGSRTFDAFGVKYVPFCVLIDARGRVLWSGNPSSLDVAEIGRLISNKND